MRIRYYWLLLVTVSLCFFTFCKKTEVETPISPATTVVYDIESGSIGEITRNSNTDWELYLADDNNNPELPDSWRNWWYVKFENTRTDSLTQIVLSNRGWPYYYLPVFSYDQNEWHRFTEDEVTQNEDNELIITHRFLNEEVWIARFYPYTFTDLEAYMKGLEGNPFINIMTPGYSQEGKPIYLLKITNSSFPVSDKKRVLMHARTHPAETPSSFLIEGMVNYLLESSELLSKFEFYIFPMQNVDGVTVGNYRSTPQSENLEVMWNYEIENPMEMVASTPPEIKVIHDYVIELMNDGGPPITMALNLHASNSEPDIRPFFYPHFGFEAQGYDSLEASLWEKQISLIHILGTHHGPDMIEPIPAEGGSSFASKTYPESWWWVNYKDQVMAMTMEMTYGRAGYSPRWIEPDDLRDLGKSLILSINDYYDENYTRQSIIPVGRDINNSNLRFPELYPPYDKDELKK